MDITYSSLAPAASLRGKTVLVTGAARGAGRAVVEALDELGCFVLAVDRDAGEMRDLELDAIAATEAIGMDVADRRECISFAQGWGDEPIHAMINAAAGAPDAGGAGTGVSAPGFGAHWDRVLQTTLTGTANMIQALLPALRAGRASVVNFCPETSAAPMPGATARAAASGGLVQLTRALAIELASEGMRVNAVAPMLVPPSAGSPPGAPENMIGPVLFLASAMSRCVNGVIVRTSGGISMG